MDHNHLRILLYAIVFGGVLLYLYIQRRRSKAKYYHEFKENLQDLGSKIARMPYLSFDEKTRVLQLFWDVQWMFTGVILQEYIEESGVAIPHSENTWEERCLDLTQLLHEQRISQQQVDMLLDMSSFMHYLETARWPGLPFDEQEFIETSMKKIPFYYETMNDLVTTIEESRRDQGQ